MCKPIGIDSISRRGAEGAEEDNFDFARVGYNQHEEREE